MKKVLIAEDDPSTQSLIAKSVEKMGHIAFVSPNGKHALETLTAKNNFDLLITDMMMPEMDGKELVTALRDLDRFKNLPIIMISAFVGTKEIVSLMETGVTYFQAKPLNISELGENIERCWGV